MKDLAFKIIIISIAASNVLTPAVRCIRPRPRRKPKETWETELFFFPQRNINAVKFVSHIPENKLREVKPAVQPINITVNTYEIRKPGPFSVLDYFSQCEFAPVSMQTVNGKAQNNDGWNKTFQIPYQVAKDAASWTTKEDTVENRTIIEYLDSGTSKPIAYLSRDACWLSRNSLNEVLEIMPTPTRLSFIRELKMRGYDM
ncbi:MAG: hypothetical protein FWE50_03975 [Alphaproteobacteria bacterium]|nr:hypothetical protein [Alphaproteobacteria bacterium]